MEEKYLFIKNNLLIRTGAESYLKLHHGLLMHKYVQFSPKLYNGISFWEILLNVTYESFADCNC